MRTNLRANSSNNFGHTANYAQTNLVYFSNVDIVLECNFLKWSKTLTVLLFVKQKVLS